MKILSFNHTQIITTLFFILFIGYSLSSIYEQRKQNEKLAQPSRLFIEGLYQGFNFTVQSNTLQSINHLNLNLTQLDDSFNVLGESLIYPEKLESAVKLIYDFFEHMKEVIPLNDKEGQYIIDQHLQIFKDLKTFQTKAINAYNETTVNPLLFYWDSQDYFPYGLYKEYGRNIAYTSLLMIPSTQNDI